MIVGNESPTYPIYELFNNIYDPTKLYIFGDGENYPIQNLNQHVLESQNKKPDINSINQDVEKLTLLDEKVTFLAEKASCHFEEIARNAKKTTHHDKKTVPHQNVENLKNLKIKPLESKTKDNAQQYKQRIKISLGKPKNCLNHKKENQNTVPPVEVQSLKPLSERSKKINVTTQRPAVPMYTVLPATSENCLQIIALDTSSNEYSCSDQFKDAIRGLKNDQAIEFYLQDDLENKLNDLDESDRENTYRKLIERCTEAMKPKLKEPIPKEKIGIVKDVLKKHLQLVEREAVDINKHYFHDMVEAAISSFDFDACCLGLRILSCHFIDTKVSNAGKEVILASRFLENRKKHPPELSDLRREFELNFIKANPVINYCNLFLSITVPKGIVPKDVEPKDVVPKDIDMAISYCLMWLKKIQNYNARYIETEQDKQCYLHLKTLISKGSQEDIDRIFDAFDKIPLNSIKDSVVVRSVQEVYHSLFTRSFSLAQNDQSKELEILDLFCKNLSKLSGNDVNDLDCELRKIMFSIMADKDDCISHYFQCIDSVLVNRRQPMTDEKKKRIVSDCDKKEVLSDTKSSDVINLFFEYILNQLCHEGIEFKIRCIQTMLDIYSKGKKQFNFSITAPSFIFHMGDCYKNYFNKYTDDVEEAVLENIQSCDLSFNLHISKPAHSIPSDFFKHFIMLSIDKISHCSSEQSQANLIKNVIKMAGWVLKSKEPIPEKQQIINNIFTIIPYIADNNLQLQSQILDLLLSAKQYYRENEVAYLSHLYNLEKFMVKEMSPILDDYNTQQPMQREAIGRLAKILLNDSTVESFVHLNEILHNKHVGEFVDNLDDLLQIYKSLLAKLKEMPDRKKACSVIGNWLDWQIDLNNEKDNLSIFSRDKVCDNDVDKEVHREFIQDLVSTYRTICESVIESDSSLKKTSCHNLFARFSAICRMGAFTINSYADLLNFKHISDILVKFLKDQEIAFFISESINSFFVKFWKVLEKSTIKDNIFNEIENLICSEWKSIKGLHLPLELIFVDHINKLP